MPKLNSDKKFLNKKNKNNTEEEKIFFVFATFDQMFFGFFFYSNFRLIKACVRLIVLLS